MSHLQYKTIRQTRPRTIVGRELSVPHGLVAHSSDGGFEILSHATECVTEYSIVADIHQDYQFADGILDVLEKKKRVRHRRRVKSISGEIGRRDTGKHDVSKGHACLLNALVVGAIDYATVESKKVHELVADDGTRYPLRVPIDIAKRLIGGSSRFSFMQSEALSLVLGEDTDEQTAFTKLASGFHRLVKTHWNKPPHLRTDEDEKMNCVLEHLVDWDRFHELNPIEQPLWGKLLELLENGDVRVKWMIGPNDASGDTTVVRSKDVRYAMRNIQVGNWFYGSGKVYPNRIEWIDQPAAVPDPYDAAAVRAAWDLIPPHVMSDPNAWPLKKGG